MKLKELEAHLQEVTPFREPNVMLEQYPTSAHIAARMLFTMESVYGDVEDKMVLDLGCGCGILGIAAGILGAGATLGVELDPAAMQQAIENAQQMEVDLELQHANVADMLAASSAGGTAGRSKPPQLVDTVVMNPPFGTRCAGIDMQFLSLALRLATGAVYSLHKSSTRAHVAKVASALGATTELLAELRYDIPQMYSFHKKQTADVEVDFLRFEVGAYHPQTSAMPTPYVPPDQREEEGGPQRLKKGERARQAGGGSSGKGGGGKGGSRGRARGGSKGGGGNRGKRGGRR